ncbi:MAG: DUF3592 domain-containing protein [Opitutaceae bacterium]|nr:DUF3592 domain-containing protein [Opitutaceae bacterium]
MTTFLMLLGILLLLAGGLTFLLPERMWRGLTARGSRWANQASTAGLLIFAGLGWLGLMLLIVYSGALWLGWRSDHWVKVAGTVVESRVVETRQVRSTNPAYRAQVVYRYQVDGHQHRGERVDFAGASTVDRAAVEEAVRTRYAPGAVLTVFVDPGDGTQSVLEPGVPPKAAILASLGMVFGVISCWQLIALWRDWEGDRVVPQESRRKRNRRA